MSPMVRGRFIVQIENAGRPKNSFDVLLWIESPSQKSVKVLDTVQVLREYLGTLRPQAICINLWVPTAFGKACSFLNSVGITSSPIPAAAPSEDIVTAFGESAPAGICQAAATALSCDADLVVTENSDWYPFHREFENLNTLVGSVEIILRQSEIFVSGHNLPWSFEWPMFDATWSSFYFFAGHRVLAPAFTFLDVCQKKNVDANTREVGRSFVYNRIPNILFTRDRLLFYEVQRAAAKRAKWERQKFVFEIGYHLNFYYILLYGGFDHLAVLVNGVLGLGMPARDVTARGKTFLNKLNQAAPEIYAIFKDSNAEDFIERISALRHSAAHRSQVMPSPIYEQPDHEPTLVGLDEEIRAKGLDREFLYLPEGPLRDWAREHVRFKLRLSKHKLVLEDAVLLDTNKIKGFINPLIDTEWNFSKFDAFANAVLKACTKRLQ